MKKIIRDYNLPVLIEVAKDRAEDFSNIREEYEESYIGESEINPDKCYAFGFGDKLDEIVELLMRINESIHSTESILIGASEDLVAVLKEYIDCMVDSHLDAWIKRYERRSEEEVAYDLNVNHDPSNQLDFIEEKVGRELADDEQGIVESYFNESVLDELFNR